MPARPPVSALVGGGVEDSIDRSHDHRHSPSKHTGSGRAGRPVVTVAAGAAAAESTAVVSAPVGEAVVVEGEGVLALE